MRCERCRTNAFALGQCFACGYEGEGGVFESHHFMQPPSPKKPKEPVMQLSLLDYASAIERSIAVLRERA